MKKIQEIVDLIDEELEGAHTYAEKYVEYKVENDTTYAGRFKTMANDELNHASMLHELAVREIDKLKTIYEAPASMQEKWDKAHVDYVDKAAWVKQMLTL